MCVIHRRNEHVVLLGWVELGLGEFVSSFIISFLIESRATLQRQPLLHSRPQHTTRPDHQPYVSRWYSFSVEWSAFVFDRSGASGIIIHWIFFSWCSDSEFSQKKCMASFTAARRWRWNQKRKIIISNNNSNNNKSAGNNGNNERCWLRCTRLVKDPSTLWAVAHNRCATRKVSLTKI